MDYLLALVMGFFIGLGWPMAKAFAIGPKFNIPSIFYGQFGSALLFSLQLATILLTVGALIWAVMTLNLVGALTTVAIGIFLGNVACARLYDVPVPGALLLLGSVIGGAAVQATAWL